MNIEDKESSEAGDWITMHGFALFEEHLAAGLPAVSPEAATG